MRAPHALAFALLDRAFPGPRGIREARVSSLFAPGTQPTEMNTTRIKYLDMDACPRVALNELLVVGIFCMGIPFGVWWLGCLLFEWLGWEAFHAVFHVAGFVAAFLFAFGLTHGAKTTATAASYGALFLDAALAALFFWIVSGEFRTLWTVAALVGLAAHVAGRIPFVAAVLARRDARKDEEGLRQTAEMLVEQGKDPELVRQAMDEARAAKDEPGVSSSASFRLLDILAKKERPAAPPSED